MNGKLISLRTGQVHGLPAVLSNMRLALERKLDLITFGSWPQIRNLVDAYRSKDVPESFSSSRSFLDDHEALAGSAKLLESKITSSSTLRSRFFIHTGSSDSYQWSQGAFIISFQRVSFKIFVVKNAKLLIIGIEFQRPYLNGTQIPLHL